MAKLETDHGPFVKLFSSGHVYVVPEYQRAYSWKPDKQVAELWGDIARLYRSRLAGDLPKAHFIGSVVLGSAATKAMGSSECPVIDGQQRLITLSLILAAIRDEVVTDSMMAARLNSKYLVNAEEGQGDDVEIRLQPGVSDRAAFEAIILGDESVPRGKVRKAYDFVVTQLRAGPTDADIDDSTEEESEESAEETELDEEIDSDDDAGETENEGAEEYPDATPESPLWDWNVLIEVVGTQLELVAISDVAPENAYQIFATLNSTGLELAQLDLIRNALFMLLPTRGPAAHKKYWLPMEKAMGAKWMEAYLHAWVIRRGHNVPAKEAYRSTMFELSRAGIDESAAEKVLKSWHSGAWGYLLLADPNGNLRSKFATGNEPAVPKSMKAALIRLRQWGTVPLEPVVLELLDRFQGKKLSAGEVTKMLALLESFVVRRFIVGTPPNDLRSIFARLTQQVAKAKDGNELNDILLDGLNESNRRWPTDIELIDALKTRPLYRKPVRHCFFVLKRVAEALEGKEAPQIALGKTSNDYSIEHVMPQNLTLEWQQDLKTWGDPNPQETWSKLRHTIGNLTLTAYNSELSDRQFISATGEPDKVTWIRDHLRLALSTSMVTKKKWTRSEIETRSDSLAAHAVKLWPRS